MRVVVTSDFFRDPAVTHRNIAKLFSVVRAPIEAATGRAPETFLPNPLNPRVWPLWFERQTNRADSPWLYAQLDQLTNAIVIVFECPPVMRYAMEKIGIRYINVTVHPIRFANDLFLGMESNDVGINNRILNCHWARFPNDFRNMAMRQMNGVGLSGFRNGAAVFFAQCEKDSSLIRKGRFVTWDAVKDDVLRLAYGRKFFVKPHPSQKHNAFVRGAVAAGAKVLDVNTYSLFRSAAIFKPITLNSSVAAEAFAFGLNPYCLLPLMPTGTAIEGGFSSSVFWRWVLGSKGENRFIRTPEKDYLRRVFNAWWSMKS